MVTAVSVPDMALSSGIRVSSGYAGFLTFDILNEVKGHDSVKVNGIENDASYQTVSVSNDIDDVSVEFDVEAGYTTQLPINKSYRTYALGFDRKI
ncbi:MAG: hypothetical protein METHP_00759 [Methanoregula sp. SKADARSKE-2]|nr:MAG: hypothetical protein METHP_00759 [Methanoregula sp. SKADARSKE-2]